MSGFTNQKEFNKIFDNVLKEVPKEKFVVYPEQYFSTEELIQQFKMSENEIESTNLPDDVTLAEGINEPRELTEEEKREALVKSLVASKMHYKPKKQFGTAYKKKRQAKNKAQRASRRGNRK